MSTSTITEYLLQPRTGAQCTTSPAPGSGVTGNICQGKQKQFSWDYQNSKAVTLGYAASTNTIGSDATKSCQTFMGTDTVYVWGNLNNDSGGHSHCISPVPQLCYLDGPWDGLEYNPNKWTKSALSNVFSSAAFPATCAQSIAGTKYGGESSQVGQSCPLACVYDANKFTTIDQVEAYERKYPKYLDDTHQCFVDANGKSKVNSDSTTARKCLLKTTGAVTNNPTNQKPFTDNYTKIMTYFCAQPAPQAFCPIDPITGKQATKCSMLMSTGAEGRKCKAWYNMFGPYKSTIADSIGNHYCTYNPDSYECRCYSRTKDGNPDSATFKKVSADINSAMGEIVSPACYYIPCSDMQNFIVPSDVFGAPSSGIDYKDLNYGYKCLDTLCANVLTSGASTYMDGDNAYIQCTPESQKESEQDGNSKDKTTDGSKKDSSAHDSGFINLPSSWGLGPIWSSFILIIAIMVGLALIVVTYKLVQRFDVPDTGEVQSSIDLGAITPDKQPNPNASDNAFE